MTPNWYLIHIDGTTPIDAPRPEVLPEPGDILVFSEEWHTPIGQVYVAGDEVHLMKRTDEAPHGRRSELGNWVAISKFGALVWSNIEWLLADNKVRYLE